MRSVNDLLGFSDTNRPAWRDDRLSEERECFDKQKLQDADIHCRGAMNVPTHKGSSLDFLDKLLEEFENAKLQEHARDMECAANSSAVSSTATVASISDRKPFHEVDGAAIGLDTVDKLLIEFEHALLQEHARDMECAANDAAFFPGETGAPNLPKGGFRRR